jgi:glycosyltransferase involved in cell wall biosynthesis
MHKILLIGSTPPPIGGVTIHIDRFLNLYNENGKFNISVFDLKKKAIFQKNNKITNIFKIFLFLFSSKVIHIHVSNDFIKLLFALIGKLLFKKVVYTQHNCMVKNKFAFKFMYKLCNKVILVNYKGIDKSLININKTETIPAFLPPYRFNKLPNSLENEIKKYNQIISTNCYSYALINGEHIYGFDLIIKAFYKLSKERKIKNTLLILVDPSKTTRGFVNDLLKQKTFQSNKILLVTEKLDFVSLIKKSDITIRATRTDGDSLSIRESLYCNVPIICSDVTERPEGVVVFNNDDSDDLSDKILNTLNSKVSFKYKSIDYGKKILDIYDELVGV